MAVEVASRLTDALLFVRVAALVVQGVRRATEPRYAVRVIRSPDGAGRSYRLPAMTVQRAALEVLQRYLVDFPVLQQTAPAGKRGRGSTGSPASASTRLADEAEAEKRVRKRRMRLLVAVEEAFSHVRKLAASQKGAAGGDASAEPDKTLDPYEAAQAVFPTLIRPLQKYIRVTRQQARHPVDTVIDHLALCLAYGLSPQAFLERFDLAASAPQQDAATAAGAVFMAKRALRLQAKQGIKPPPPGQQMPSLPRTMASGGQQRWSLVADRPASQTLVEGAVFQLRRGDQLSLLCLVHRLPLLQLAEESAAEQPFEAGRFVLSAAPNNTV